MKKITLPYGHEQRVIEIPEENLAWIEGPRHAPRLPDIPAAVRHNLVPSSHISSDATFAGATVGGIAAWIILRRA